MNQNTSFFKVLLKRRVEDTFAKTIQWLADAEKGKEDHESCPSDTARKTFKADRSAAISWAESGASSVTVTMPLCLRSRA